MFFLAKEPHNQPILARHYAPHYNGSTPPMSPLLPHPLHSARCSMPPAKLLGSVALSFLLALQAEAVDRPNILYVCTDQQFAETMSCTGNPCAKTSAIDQIAKRGMRFANAYCASPVCSPSRGSMFTGLFPHQHGVTVNNTRIDAGLSEICLARLLDRKGYECAYAGKWHLPGGAMTKTDLKQHPYRILAGPSDERVSDTCAQFLAEERDRPFFLVASYMNPHDICLWAMDRPKGYQKYPVPQAPTEDCPPLPENFGVSGDEPSVLREFYMARHVEQKSFNRERWRQYLHAYYWMLETVDSDIGRLLDALETGDLDKNTLIVFSSDHGDGLGTHDPNREFQIRPLRSRRRSRATVRPGGGSGRNEQPGPPSQVRRNPERAPPSPGQVVPGNERQNVPAPPCSSRIGGKNGLLRRLPAALRQQHHRARPCALLDAALLARFELA